MAIKVLGRTSIIIRRDAIEQKVPGGWDAFFRHIELGICCGEVLYDDYLVAIHRRWVGLEAVKEFAPLGLLLWEWDWDTRNRINLDQHMARSLPQTQFRLSCGHGP